MKTWIGVVGSMVLGLHGAIGDTLYFKNGKSFECEVVDFSNMKFTVLLNGNRQQAPAANIERIEFSAGVPCIQPATIAPQSTESDPDASARHSIKSYLAGKTFTEVVECCTPKEIQEKAFSLENAPVKLVFRGRAGIEQIGADEYITNLYGDNYESILMCFTEEGQKYIRSIRESFNSNEAPKKYALYGIILTPKTMAAFQEKYPDGQNVFIPLGRSTSKAIGNKGITYSW